MLILSQSDEHTTWTRSMWSSVGEMWSSSGSSWGLKEDSSIKTCPQSRFGLNIETIQDFSTSKFLNFNKVLNALPRTIQFPIRLFIGPWTIMRVRSGFSRWGRKNSFLSDLPLCVEFICTYFFESPESHAVTDSSNFGMNSLSKDFLAIITISSRSSMKNSSGWTSMETSSPSGSFTLNQATNVPIRAFSITSAAWGDFKSGKTGVRVTSGG